MKKGFYYLKLLFDKIHLPIYFGVVSFIALYQLSYSKMNFWTDNPGLISIYHNLLKYFYLWNNNVLGTFMYTTPSSFPNYLYTKIVYSVFGLEYGTYFYLFFLVYFTALSAYLLLKEIQPNKLANMIIVLLFIFNPIFLYFLYGRGTGALLIAYIGVILFITFIHNYLKNGKLSALIKIVLASTLITHPFIFPFLCLTICYILLVNKKYKAAILSFALLILFNFYWIFTFLTSFLFPGNTLLGSYTKDLIGSSAKLGQFQYSFLFIGRSFAYLSEMFKYPYIIYVGFFLLWGVLIYFSFFKKRKSLIFLYYWLYVFFLLAFSIGPRGTLGSIYRYFLDNFSTFSFFRSYQNIFIILIIFVFYLCLLLAKQERKFSYFLQGLSILCFISFFLFQNINFTSRSSNIPTEYFDVKKIVDDDKSINRVLLLPYSVYDYYRWDNPKNDKYFLQTFFNKSGLVFYRPTIDNTLLYNFYNKINSGLDYENDLYNLGVKYILLRKDLTKSDIGYYTPLKQPIPGKLLLSTNNIELYSLDAYKPIITGNNVLFSRENPILYKIMVKNLHGKDGIHFLESFHYGWNLYINKFDSDQNCGEYILFPEERTTECLLKKGTTIKDRLDTKILDAEHIVSPDGYTNTWIVDSDEIKQGFNRSYYKENSDGSIDMELTLYFKPQSYLYLGLIISGTTLLGCLEYLGVDLIKRKKKNKELEKVYENGNEK